MQKRILITGANGYVGNILARHLSCNYNVIATARNIAKITVPNVNRYTLDVLSSQQTRKAICATTPDVVIHAAALPKRSKADEKDFINCNVEGAKNIALATKQFSNAKFIMISSGCAYKQKPNHIITSTSDRETGTVFARSKNLAEQAVCQTFTAQQYRVAIVYPPVILHPTQIIGIIPAVLHEALRDGFITNRLPNGHVNFVHHVKFSQLIEAIARDQHSKTLQRYLLTGNRFTTKDFFMKLQTTFSSKLGVPCNIRSVIDPSMETMCETDENRLMLNFPEFKWGSIDDVILDISRNNFISTALITNQLNQRPLPSTQSLNLTFPSWIPKDRNNILALDQILSQQEKAILQSAETNIAEFFIESRKKMLEAKLTDNEFPYTIFEPVLKRIILGMIIKFEKELLYNSKIFGFIKEAFSLLEDQVPYKKTMRFLVRYLHYIDELFLKIHPSLSSSFHRNNAEHVLESLLKSAPDVLLYPSFQKINVDYFLNTRSAPFHIVGIDMCGLKPNEQPPYADGFPMKPSEFFWHDIGHIEFMQEKDSKYFQKTFKPIERVIREWNFTCRRIAVYLKSIKENINLFDATQLILFEILHERGFQYSFAVLKAELDTPKWNEILNRKFKNNYYKNSPEINLSLFAELDNARNKLLEFVVNSRCKDQKAHIEAFHGQELPIRATHFPQVNYGQGFLQKIIIEKSGVSVLLQTNNSEITTRKVSELILAQINPTKNTPFDIDTRRRIEMVFDEHSDAHYVSYIAMSLDKTINVVLRDGKQIPLEDFVPNAQEKNIGSKNRHYFELEQVLGSYERSELISYTHQEESSVHIGTVHYHLESNRIEIKNGDRVVIFPLSEVLIDPLQKEDFVVGFKYQP